MAAQHAHDYELVAFADPALLRARAQQLGLKLTVKNIDLHLPPQPLQAGELGVVPVTLPAPCVSGVLAPENAGYVLTTLDQAIHACQHGYCHAMVTGPVQKSVINDAGHPFSGHTEYLAKATNTPRVVMMLATEGLRVALVTTHIPLHQVAQAITRAALNETLSILQRDLQQQFGIAQPRILVCGLNPHAGEGGHLGREEIDTIEPVLDTLRQQGMHLVGPLPADTLFTPKYLNNADAVLAMYHDQGLPVLKYKGFGRAVNITLGLPIIRTSVDHGTALDLAGTGKVDTGSLNTALRYAADMVSAKHTRKSTQTL